MNPVNPFSQGSLRITVFGSESFDVADVRPESWALGPERGFASEVEVRDSDRDGRADVTLRFPVSGTGIAFGDERVCLRGSLTNGRRFYTPSTPRIPVEFQTSAYRFGHSMVRPSYRANLAGDDGRLLYSIGGEGDAAGRLNAPTYLALSGQQIFVTDTLNARVQLFDTDGNYRSQFGERGLYIGAA